MTSKAARLRRKRAGRKPKAGERYHCGKRKATVDPREPALNARMKNHGLSRRQAADPRAGSALGRLALAGTVTDQCYDAGVRFEEVVRAHFALQGLPPPTARAICYEDVIRGYGESASGDIARAIKVRDTFLGCLRLFRGAPVTLHEVYKVAVRDEDACDVAAAVHGLSLLKAHFSY